MAPKLNRNQRTKAAAAEYQESLVAQREEKVLQEKSNEDLFTVDTNASVERKKRKIDAVVKVKTAPKSKEFPKYRAATKKNAAVDEIGDIWGATSVKGSNKKLKVGARLTPAHAKPATSHPGMSYNPQTDDHQDIVAKAVAVELRRSEAKQMKDPLWLKAIEQTQQEFDSNEEDSSDSEEEEEELGHEREIEKRVNRGKLTRAERNKRNRHKQSVMQQRQSKRRQQMLSEISSAKKIAKEINLKNSQVVENVRKDSNPTQSFAEVANRLMSYNAHANAPEVTAPLTDELSGSLRNIKTKSAAIYEQLSVKQFAVDPSMSKKRILKPDSQKNSRKIKNKLKVKTTDRYHSSS